MMDKGARAREARRLLGQAGVEAAVAAAGPEGDVAAVTADRGAWNRVRELAPRIRALGFRYVALDLAPDELDPGGAGPGGAAARPKDARAVERT